MPRLQRLLVTAIFFQFGIEMLRALLPLLVFGLRDRFGWAALGPIGAVRILGIALGLFALVFFAGLLTRWLGRRSMLRACVVAAVACRVLAQAWSGDPLGNLVVIMLGLLGFLLFWPAWLGSPASGQGASHRRDVGLGVLLGTTLSASLHGVLLTYDAIWRVDLPHFSIALGLIAVLLVALWRLPQPTPADATAVSSVASGAWFAFGPFIFLQLMIFLNLARLTVLTDWSQTASASFQVLCHGLAFAVAALGAAATSTSQGWSTAARRTVWLAAAIALLVSVYWPWPTGGSAALGMLIGQVAVAWLWILVCNKSRATPPRAHQLAVGTHGVGMLMLLLLLFLYYAGYDLPLPFEQVVLLPFAALLIALAAWPRASSEANSVALRPLANSLLPIYALLAALIVLPWLRVLGASNTSQEGIEAAQATSPVRVMTYNLHCGFGAAGYLRLEEQAKVIESQNPDVVALQEISRGWIINGGVDMLAWLAHRLDMEYRFAPTADPLWGNATLTRLPIVASRHFDYPRSGKQQIRRGLVEVDLDVGGRLGDDAPQLRVINTHFHHRRSDSDVRVGQAQTLLEFWDLRPQTLLVGDLNAVPESPEMQRLRDAGLVDTVERSPIDPGLTFRSDGLERRIDYIWATPDLATADVVVVDDTASDHLAIAATFLPAPQQAPSAALGDAPVPQD